MRRTRRRGQAPGDRPERAPRQLLLVTFVSTLDRFAMAPMLVAMARDLGTPLSAMVHAASAYFLAYGLTQPLWGMIADRFGLVRTMRTALVLAATATAVAATLGSAPGLAIARGLAGACFSAAIPACLVYVGDTVPAPRRQPQITNLMTGAALGTALASAGAGALAQYTSWRLVFAITGAAALLLAASLGRVPEPPLLRANASVLAPVAAVARSRPTLMVLGLAFVEGMVVLGALTLLPAAVEATGASGSVAGAVTAAYGIAVLGGARLAGKAAQRVHTSRLIAFGAVSATAACALTALSRAPELALPAAALLGLAWVSMHSSLQTWATEVLPCARATVIAGFAMALFLGSALAAVLAGGYAEAGRYAEIFAMAAALAVPLGLAATVGRTRWTRPEGEHGR
ncbi:MFS transporter [Actinomadura sp. SCN-SB]|uniref:MFS transporter n=1 Tax=Actinomadura sp. SCN-SB TaxID=3373092 RepID=UPI0037529A6E